LNFELNGHGGGAARHSTAERRESAVLLLIAAATLWGAIGPVAELAFRAGMAPLEVAFWRALLAAPCFAALWVRSPGAAPRGGDLGGMALFGVLGIAGMYGGFFVAARSGGTPLAATLLYTGPAWVALVQRARGRPLGLSGMAGLGLSLLGVAVLTGAGGGPRPPVLAVIAGLCSGFAFATHFVLAPRYIGRLGSPLVFAVAMAAGALTLAPFARPTLPAAGALPAIVFIVLGSTLLASLCFGRAVVRLAPVKAAVLSTWEPVVACSPTSSGRPPSAPVSSWGRL
jgi:drug/metabolite transporter, DME family